MSAISDLENLRKTIRKENTLARSAARTSLDHVRACGEMLTVLKSKIPHGSWIPELKSLGIERKTASNYMRIAEKWETVSHLNHGVRDALKLLCRADDPPPSARPSPPAPATSKSPLPMGAVHIEAVIVEPEAQVSPLASSITTKPTAADFDGKEFYEIILAMLPHLTKAEIVSLSETLKTRWL